MRNLAGRPDLCSINTATLGYQTSIGETIEAIARHGFGGISPWRREVEDGEVAVIARQIRDAGLQVASYCRSNFIPAARQEQFRANIEDNKRAIRDAATLGAPCFVMVVGGLAEGSKDLAQARAQVEEATTELLTLGREVGVRISLEPLHPVYAADRSCLNTTAQVLDICDRLDPKAGEAPWLGVCLDVYHIWWDPDLDRQIGRAGRRVHCFHVCDWRLPSRDPLNDRAMMGDGVIDIPAIRGAVERAGYEGFVEVEIFSALDWWRRPVDEILTVCKERFASAC
jgi:sugar phosphate isomerase/epimerase